MSLCQSLGVAFGEQAIQTIATITAFVLVWWQARKKANTAHAVAADAQAKLQKQQVEIAELRASLRPAAPINVPVRITGPGASMPDPSMLEGDVSLPPPAAVPGKE